MATRSAPSASPTSDTCVTCGATGMWRSARQTLREQPRLLQTPQEPGDPPMPAFYEFRHAHGLPAQPRHVVYSLGGCLDIAMPVFNTPGVEAIIVTTEKEPPTFCACGAPARGVDLIVDALEDTDGLRRAHARLFAERGVRYVACEGDRRCWRRCGEPASWTRSSSRRRM